MLLSGGPCCVTSCLSTYCSFKVHLVLVSVSVYAAFACCLTDAIFYRVTIA